MEDYRKIELKGKGSYGQAVLVQNVNDRRFYIMKMIDVWLFDRKQKEDALNEVNVLKDLQHQCIIRYRESFVDKRQCHLFKLLVFIINSRYLCIVMDYADDGNLDQKIQQQKKLEKQYFNEDLIVDWFAQICLAVQYVHQRNIIHRDIKTQNVFLNSNGNAKLGDFGIAKILGSSDDLCKTSIGTPYYISPEICQKQGYDQKSDIWSLGCILYEMMALRHAFDAKNLFFFPKGIEGLFIKILRGEYPPLPNHYSSQLKELVEALLQREPERRPTIEQILGDYCCGFIKQRGVGQYLTRVKQQPQQQQYMSCEEKREKKLDIVQKKYKSDVKQQQFELLSDLVECLGDRIETLRVEIEEEMGLDEFLSVYELCQKGKYVGTNKKLLKLIELEQKCYSKQNGKK